MEEETIISVALALLVSFLLCLPLWPREKKHRDLYMEVLDFDNWKHHDQIYEEVLGKSKVPISESEHEQILRELEQDDIVEAQMLGAREVAGTDGESDFGRILTDQMIGYAACLEYRLISEDDSGGIKQKLKRFLSNKQSPLCLSH